MRAPSFQDRLAVAGATGVLGNEALWTPQAHELLQLAQWLRESGASTLAIVVPHTQMRLPEALKRGPAVAAWLGGKIGASP